MKTTTVLLTMPFLALAEELSVRHVPLASESRLSYRLSHPLHAVTGVSRAFQCEVDLGPDTTRARVHVKVSAASFNSGNATRDANVLELLEAYRYPYVEFFSDSLRREGARWRVFGALTFHGVRRQLDFTVTPKIAGDRTTVRGGFGIRLSDYRVPRPTLLWIPVSDSLRIDLSLVARTP
jgi:polyisoprenoid-binding protein YceI